MDLISWLPALITSLATTIGLRIWLPARIQKSIQHEYDRKLEVIRADLRKEEERLKADLKRKDDEISSIRSAALSAMGSRHAALDKRRLEATERVWGAISGYGSVKLLARFCERINMDTALDLAAKQDREGQSVRQFAEDLWKASGVDPVKLPKPPEMERPFLTPNSWAAYSALSGILGVTMIQFAALRFGAGKKMLKEPDVLLATVKSVLPHQAEYVDKWKVSCLPFLIAELEERLLAELVAGLNGPSIDERGIRQAVDIAKSALDQLPAVVDLKIPDIPGLAR